MRAMNLAHFGLTRRPFRPTPDTSAYYPAAGHEAALGGLRSAFAARDGLALLDGDPGTGKTLVALRFLEGLDVAVPRVLIPAPRFVRPADFYQAILFDVGAEYRGLTEQELRLAVTEKLLVSLSEGHPTVIVLDEAQHLIADVLEEIRLLGNLETRSAKAAFVVLVAQPSLRERLAGPDLGAFAQRVAARCRVEPLSREESVEYVRHQVKVVGGHPGTIVGDEALDLLAARCKGVPRLLNQAAALAFTLAGAAGADVVDAEAAVESLDQLGLSEPPDQPTLIAHPARSPKRRVPKRKSA
jgi:type II secretory pathway predicted ATPase ExeA